MRIDGRLLWFRLGYPQQIQRTIHEENCGCQSWISGRLGIGYSTWINFKHGVDPEFCSTSLLWLSMEFLEAWYVYLLLLFLRVRPLSKTTRLLTNELLATRKDSPRLSSWLKRPGKSSRLKLWFFYSSAWHSQLNSLIALARGMLSQLYSGCNRNLLYFFYQEMISIKRSCWRPRHIPNTSSRRRFKALIKCIGHWRTRWMWSKTSKGKLLTGFVIWLGRFLKSNQIAFACIFVSQDWRNIKEASFRCSCPTNPGGTDNQGDIWFIRRWRARRYKRSCSTAWRYKGWGLWIWSWRELKVWHHTFKISSYICLLTTRNDSIRKIDHE